MKITADDPEKPGTCSRAPGGLSSDFRLFDIRTTIIIIRGYAVLCHFRLAAAAVLFFYNIHILYARGAIDAYNIKRVHRTVQTKLDGGVKGLRNTIIIIIGRFNP